MQNNKLRMAIRSTAALAMMGVAAQANAVSFEAGGYEMGIYGYARLNASYDFDSDQAASTRSGSFAGLANNDNAPSGHFGADAVQSRLGVTATTPEGVNIKVEGDFRGGTLRLRHAYGEYEGVLAGQTWSNFTSFVGYTSTLDFDSLPGLPGNQGRTAQLRYTTGPLSFSLEQNVEGFPDSTILNAPADEKRSLPAVTARLEDSQGGMSYTAAVIAHQMGYDDGGSNDETAVGFGTFVGASLAVSDMITVQGTVSYSNGANSYLYRSEGFGAPSAYDDGTGLETLTGFGGSVGTGISLGGGRSINIGYGIATVDYDDAEADLGAAAVAGQSETNSMIIANYKWTPVKNVMMGVEFANLSRENVNGDDGDANRLLFAAQYNF